MKFYCFFNQTFSHPIFSCDQTKSECAIFDERFGNAQGTDEALPSRSDEVEHENKEICRSQDVQGEDKLTELKLHCDTRFQPAFTARGCVFKVITLVGSNQSNYFENTTACSKRTLKMRVATRFKGLQENPLNVITGGLTSSGKMIIITDEIYLLTSIHY